MPSQTSDFKSAASTIPPYPHGVTLSDRKLITRHRRDPSIRLIQYRRSSTDPIIEAEIDLPTGKKIVSTRCNDMLDAMFTASEIKTDLLAKITETGNAALRRGRKPKVVDAGVAPAAKPKGPTFRTAADQFRADTAIKQRKELLKLAGQPSRIIGSKRTKYRSQIGIIDDKLIPAIGHLTFSEITISVVREMVQGFGIDAQNTIGNYAAAYQKVMEILAGLSNSDDEWPTISKKGSSSAVPRGTFSVAEVRDILSVMTDSWIEGTKKLRDRQARRVLRAYVHVASITGIRTGNELFRLAFGDINQVGEGHKAYWSVSVYKDQGKTKKDRETVVNGRDRACSLKAALADFTRLHGELRPSTMLFALPCDGTIPDLGSMIRDIIIARGLSVETRTGQKRSGYSFRHYYANTMIGQGADVYKLAQVMGSSVKMVEDYYGKALDRRSHAGLAGVNDPVGRLQAELERRPETERLTSMDFEAEERERLPEARLPRD